VTGHEGVDHVNDHVKKSDRDMKKSDRDTAGVMLAVPMHGHAH
jgi:hypothetical protein